MAEASQEMCSQSMYRNGHFNSRYSHHSEYSQYNGGLRRSALNGSFGMNRRHNNFVQQSHSRSVPGVVREMGLILEVHRDYGRILSLTNFSTPNIHIYFSLSTVVNDMPLSSITENLADVFQVGATVEIELEGSVDPRDLKDRVHVILTCTSIKPATEAGHEPELVPMIVIQDAGDVPLALIASHELVALPRQVFPMEEISSAFMAKKNDVTVDMEWPEFAMIGRSVEGRILNAPPWMHECTNPAIKKIALSLQRFGRDREGFAVVKEYIGQGVVLKPIDDEDRRVCGDLFFPYEMRTDASRAECQDAYRIGSKWYFRACLELPNRKHKYRVYSLDSLEDAVVNGDSSAQEQDTEQTANPSAIMSEAVSTADVPASVMEQPMVSADPPFHDSYHLIDLDNSEPLTLVPVTASTFPSTAVSPAILSMLSTVDFDIPPAVTNGSTETALLDSSPRAICSDVTGPSQCNLLLDFDDTSELQQVTTQVRQFHIVDENVALSSFDFDIKNERKTNYGAEMCGCSDQENGEDMCASPKKINPLSKNAESKCVKDGTFQTDSQKKQPMKLESIGLAPTSPAFKPVKRDEDILLCEGRFTVEHIRPNMIQPNTEQEADTSDDDSDNEMSHATAVERREDNGWWFTREFPNGTCTNNEEKMTDELSSAMKLACNNAEASALKPNSTSSEEKLLVDLSDDHPANSATMIPQSSLSSALREDDIYAKFFSGLIRK